MGRPFHTLSYKKPAREGFAVIAHRGASAYFPENTLLALEGAIDMDAEMAEIDVLLSRDGVPVVVHNEHIRRATGGSGRVAHYTLAELKHFDFGYQFKAARGERIPTLEEVLELCAGRIALNIEIKPGAVQDMVLGGIEELCVDLVYRHGMEEHVVFSSFDPRALLHCKIIDPSAATAVLYDDRFYLRTQTPAAIVEHLRADAFNCGKDEIHAKWMADCTAHEVPVNIYAVDDEKTMRRLIAMGVGGIFSNRPDVLRKTALAAPPLKPPGPPSLSSRAT